jgi:LysR family transcriptional activator of dmlA
MEDLKSLTALVLVVQTSSFTAAASQMGITAAAVSKIIGRLEKELDTRLLNRTTRQVSLTNHGRLFVEKATAALNQLDQAVDLLRESRNEPAGLVRIATNVAIGKEYILPLLADFMNQYPKVSLEMRFDDRAPDLVREGFDLGIQHWETGEKSFVARHLGDFPMILVASPAYLERKGIPRTPQDLAQHEAVSIKLNSGQLATWEFRLDRAKQGNDAGETGKDEVHVHRPKARLLITEQYDAVVNGVLLGLGVTVVFAHCVLRYLRTNELKVLLPDYDIKGAGVENNRVFLRYPHREHLPYSVRVLVDFLSDHFRNQDNLSFDRHLHAA